MGTVCCAELLSRVQLFVTLWTVARQAPLSMGILQARILEWVASPFSRGIFSTQGSNQGLLALQADSLPAKLPGKPIVMGAVGYKDGWVCFRNHIAHSVMTETNM